jgi:hypothetical protein
MNMVESLLEALFSHWTIKEKLTYVGEMCSILSVSLKIKV